MALTTTGGAVNETIKNIVKKENRPRPMIHEVSVIKVSQGNKDYVCFQSAKLFQRINIMHFLPKINHNRETYTYRNKKETCLSSL